MEIKKIAYSRYQLHWLCTHKVSLHDICKVLANCANDSFADVTPQDFENEIANTEFDFGIFVCFEEFLESEYKNASYIRTLLNDEEYIEYLKDTDEEEYR